MVTPRLATAKPTPDLHPEQATALGLLAAVAPWLAAEIIHEYCTFISRLGPAPGLMAELSSVKVGEVDFLECAPENWIGVGGAYGRDLSLLAERFPLACHGLSLSLGGCLPLNQTCLNRPGVFSISIGCACTVSTSAIAPMMVISTT